MRNPTVLFKCYYLHCFYLSIVSAIDKRMELAQLQELFSPEHIIKVFSNQKKKKVLKSNSHSTSNEKGKMSLKNCTGATLYRLIC